MSFLRLSLFLAVLLPACCAKVVSAQTSPATDKPSDPVTPAAEPVKIDPEKAACAKDLAAIVSSDTASETEKIKACYSLQLIGPSAVGAAEVLAAALREPDPVGAHARQALIAIGPGAVPALRAWLAVAPGPQRYIAADVWAQIDYDSGVTTSVLEDRLANGKPIERVEAASALQLVRQHEMVVAILAAKGAPKLVEAARQNARVTEEDTASIIHALAGEAKTDDPRAQVAALKLLADWGEQAGGVATSIRPLIESSSGEVAKYAAQSLRAMGRIGIRQLVISMGSTQPNARLLAAKTLGDASTDLVNSDMQDGIIMAFEHVLADADPNVHAAAVSGLIAFGNSARPALVRAMKSGDKDVKSAVVERFLAAPEVFIGLLHDPAAVSASATQSDVEFGRLIAGDLLARMKAAKGRDKWHITVVMSCLPIAAVEKELVSAFEIVLHDDGAGFKRKNPGEMLNEVGQAGLPAFLEALPGDESILRLNAIVLLASRSDATQNPKIIDAIVEALGDRSEMVRREAFNWARKLTPPPLEVMKYAAGFMTVGDPSYCHDPEQRVAAAQLLGRFPLKEKPGVAALVGGLSDTADAVVAASVVALRVYGDDAEPAIPRLAQLVESSAEPLACQAAKTLLSCGRDGSRLAGRYYTRRLATPHDKAAVLDAVRAINGIGADAAEATPALQNWLADSDNALRIEVAHALGQIGPAAADAIPGLSRMVDNRDGDVRNAASKALSRISPNGKGLGPALLAAVYNRDGSSVECLAVALNHSDDAMAIMPRLKAVAEDDPDLIVRAAARHAVELLTDGHSAASTTRPAG